MFVLRFVSRGTLAFGEFLGPPPALRATPASGGYRCPSGETQKLKVKNENPHVSYLPSIVCCFDHWRASFPPLAGDTVAFERNLNLKNLTENPHVSYLRLLSAAFDYWGLVSPAGGGGAEGDGGGLE